MISRELVAALVEARRRVPRPIWQSLAAELSRSDSATDPVSIRNTIDGLHNRDAAWLWSSALEKHLGIRWSEIAAAMVAVDCTVEDSISPSDLIWTGPPNKRFPVRRIDQVLYDLISVATQRVMLVTFAAHRVHHLCAHLAAAIGRGVELTLILESEEESEGQLTNDAIAAFRTLPVGKARLYYWPLTLRERNQAGRPGKLHVKCAIVDDVAVIGSANLTDDAFNRNMELGMVVREKSTVSALAEHFQELIRSSVLAEVRRSER